jgi:hypothetical protein
MAAAAAAGLRGVGFWNLDSLDYFGDRGGGEQGVRQAAAMWEAVRAFTGPAAPRGERAQRQQAAGGGGGGVDSSW